MTCGVGSAIPDPSPFSNTASRWALMCIRRSRQLRLRLGVPRSAFTTQAARRHLATLGFEVVPDRVGGQPRPSPGLLTQPSVRGPTGTAGQSASAGDWRTEAKVQPIVLAHLVHEGWQIVSQADTASRQRGTDIG